MSTTSGAGIDPTHHKHEEKAQSELSIHTHWRMHPIDDKLDDMLRC